MLNSYHGRFRGNVFEMKSRNEQVELDITPFTAIPQLQHGTMDYDMALDAMIQRE